MDDTSPCARARIFGHDGWPREFRTVDNGVRLGFGVLTVPVGQARRLLDEIVPAEVHYAAVAEDDDPELATK